MIIAQISDMHLVPAGTLAYGRVDTPGLLRRCVARLLTLDPRPDVVLCTGDLVDGGSDEEYAYLRRLLAPLPMPVFVIPGNHDERGALRRAFADDGYLPGEGFLQYVVEDYPIRIVALDTLVSGAPHGELCDERLAWLDDRLGEARERPTAVMLHHPPFITGLEHMDRMGLRHSDRLLAVIGRHPQVGRLLCGHLHRFIQTRVAGTLALTAPSSAHQLALTLGPGRRGAWIEEPSAFLLHDWSEAAGLVTHLAYVEEFGGAKPFC